VATATFSVTPVSSPTPTMVATATPTQGGSATPTTMSGTVAPTATLSLPSPSGAEAGVGGYSATTGPTVVPTQNPETPSATVKSCAPPCHRGTS
jgi:hypothetical protein